MRPRFSPLFPEFIRETRSEHISRKLLNIELPSHERLAGMINGGGSTVSYAEDIPRLLPKFIPFSKNFRPAIDHRSPAAHSPLPIPRPIAIDSIE